MKKESVQFLSAHPQAVANSLKNIYARLDDEDKSILHRYIQPGAEIFSGGAGIVFSVGAGATTCVESFGVGCSAAIIAGVSSADHLSTGIRNFGKGASEQHPTITVQALVKAGLSREAAEYVQLAIDLGASTSASAAVKYPQSNVLSHSNLVKSMSNIDREIARTAGKGNLRQYVNLQKILGSNEQNLLASANRPFKNQQITEADRAETKHPEYFGFPNNEKLRQVYRTDIELNQLAEQHLKNILSQSIKTTGVSRRYSNSWVTYTLPNGMAASWDKLGKFIGFRGVQ